MLEDLFTSKIAFEALKIAVQRLNTSYPTATNKGLEEHVEFKIIKPYIQRELLYKIDDQLDADVKAAIRDAIKNEAQKLRIKVLTK